MTTSHYRQTNIFGENEAFNFFTDLQVKSQYKWGNDTYHNNKLSLCDIYVDTSSAATSGKKWAIILSY